MRVGVDLGATRIKAGLVDAQGTLVEQYTVATGEPREGADVVRRIASTITPLLPRATSVGLAAAGVLDHATGVIRESPNFPAWRDVRLGELLEAPAILEGMRAAILKKRIDFSARSCARKVYAAVRKSLGSAGEAA